MIENYKITLTPITPIHIGNGQEIFPYEYIVKNGYLYKFNAMDLYDNLGEEQKNKFNEYAQKSLIELRTYITQIYNESLGYEIKIEASNEFIYNYDKKIQGAKNSNEENSFIVNDFVNINNKAYIPASTLKGAIKSAYLYDLGDCNKKFDYKVIKNNKGIKEIIDNNDKKNKKSKSNIYEKDILQKTNAFDDPFKSVKISDSDLLENILKVYNINVYTYNQKKYIFEKRMSSYNLCTKSVLSTNDEIKFNINLNLFKGYYNKGKVKKEITKFDILDALNLKSLDVIDNEIEFYENKAKYNETLEVYEKLKKIHDDLDKDSEALIRIGKGIGFDSTTFNLVNTNKIDINSRSLVEAIYPLGWAVIKFV
ncbi:type III-A CRISPR-associated RAMP protein Csm5 [Tepidibacter formicigenes]|uniref:CRISPR system Cms protein Csm5 n=1 Tax=Tepidibacter formicigenes DSM 15518 TaxID=1123349 RepID=A0A1M6LLK2_9FIRM|nr:type III-A CRISPR-associated RAMP protein Csm5 [Tepidibacter formicigenes]SHJ72121.1 CRISPR-associated protein Csm5 [Tepidibacter formicigenes DSM 15518]